MAVGIVHGASLNIVKNRIDKAIEEYLNGHIDKLIMTGRNEAKYMAEYASERGIPKCCIIKEDKSRNTLENLLFSKKIIEKLGCKKVKSITSYWHAERVREDSKIIFLGYDVDVVSSVDDRIRSEIEKSIREERISLIKDKLILSLYYSRWPNKLLDFYGSLGEYLNSFITKSPVFS